MKILITGMTSRMTSFNRELGFPSLLARSLRDMGHNVTMLVEYSGVEEYDAVIAGIASPLSPSSTYLVPTAQTIDEALAAGKLAAVLIDDPDVAKVAHGSASLLRKPSRLDGSFYRKRPGMDAMEASPSLRSTVLSVVERCASWQWERILWPAHPWGSGRLDIGPSSTSLVPIDPTSSLHRLMLLREAAVEPVPLFDLETSWWLGETTYTDGPAFDPSVSRMIYEVATGDRSTVAVMRHYLSAYGVLQGRTRTRGWWTPVPAMASATSTLYLPHPDEAETLGGPYYALPSTVERLGKDAYTDRVNAQRAHYDKEGWTPWNMTTTTLAGVLGVPSS